MDVQVKINNSAALDNSKAATANVPPVTDDRANDKKKVDNFNKDT